MLPRHSLLTKKAGRLLPGGPKTGVPDRLRSGDLLLEKQACWLDYTTRTDWAARLQLRPACPAETRRMAPGRSWRNAVDLRHTPLSGSPLFSKQVRFARPVDIPNWSAWGDLHSQGFSILSRTGLLFPINHTPVGDPGLAPGRLGDLKSPGSAVPAKASRREIVGMKGIAPPRLPDSESGPSAIRV